MSGVRSAMAAVALFIAAAARAEAPPDLLRLAVHQGAAPARPLGAVLGADSALVSFFATYCPPCRAEVPILQRAARRWRPNGLRVIGIALGLDDAGRVARAASAWGIDYEVYWVDATEDERVGRLLPRGLPATFVVTGSTVERHDRLLEDRDLERLVPPLLRRGDTT